MKNKILLSLLVIFAVVLSTGVAYASTPFGEPDSSISVNSVESGLSSRFVLEDNYGHLWNLNIAYGCVLYGTMHHSEDWPAYGFIFGDEMVLWTDGPGTGGWVDSLAHTGMWDFGTMTYTGKWVNYYEGTGGSGNVSMWLYGASGAEMETGPNPLIAQSGTTLGMQDSRITPAGEASGEKTATELDIQSTFGVLTDRGALCYEDWYGYIWDLDLASGCIYHGSVEGYPAYGFIFDDEAFYWANWDGPVSFVYTGEWVSDALYTGTWVDTYGASATVELWPCGGGGTEYYAVISGNGWNCAYADDDAFDVYNALVSSSNWDSSNIKLLVSTASGSIRDCTYTKIRDEIAWMASQADADDVCVFWYSGHGGYMNDVYPYDESDGYDEYICPEGSNIIDDELTTWMSAIDGYKLVGIDSCFSGGFIKDEDLTIRSAPGMERALINGSFREDLTLAGFNVHTACDEDESAYGSGALENGVFTYYFVQGLYGPADSNSDGVVDALEAHYYTRPRVQAYTGSIQNPWLWYGTDEPLIWVE